MLTIDDIKKLTDFFATKEEVKQEIEKMVTKEEFREKHDEIMSKLDAVFGELKTIRQEQVAHQAQHERIDEGLEKIKAVPVAAHALKS